MRTVRRLLSLLMLLPSVLMQLPSSLMLPVMALVTTACERSPRPEAAAPTGPPRLLVLASQIGYVEPCGCTVDLTLGGIDRLATVVDAERAKGPTAVLVVGPTLFEGPPPAHRVPQDEAKAELIARSLEKIGVAAFVPGAADLARGPTFFDAVRRTWRAPDVTANVAGGAGRVLELGDTRIGVFGLAASGARVPGGVATDPAAAAEAEAARLRAAGAHVVVALAALPRRDLRRLARRVKAVDLWILGEHPNELSTASPAGKGYLIEAGDRARNLGRVVLLDAARPGPLTDPAGDAARAQKALELQLQMRADLYERTGDAALEAGLTALKQQLAALEHPVAHGKRFEYTLLPVDRGVTPRPDVAAWLAAYQQSLKALNLAAAGDVLPVPEGESSYVGDVNCRDCHKEAYALWQSTPHGRAWRTLDDAEKTFDAECVGCHVTGWQKPGGSVLGKVVGRENVQCEACHGPGSKHVETGGDEHETRRLVPEEVCRGCHHPHHSPTFDYATYRPKILGEGHRARAE